MIFRKVNKQKKSKKEQKDIISWRGHEVTRIEAFSDAVFAFAITLLVVSLEVPRNFDELKELLLGFIPFAVCFVLFFQVWTTQNLFFRRYGLHDERTIALNAALLFAMLFFVYPLKFLWTVLFNFKTAIKDSHDMTILMYIYAGGFIAIYTLLALMYMHAYNRREHLKLTDKETFETRTNIYINFGTASVGIISIVFASMDNKYSLPLSGASYSLIGVVLGRIHGVRGKVFKSKFGEPELSDIEVVNEPSGERIEP